MVTCWYYLFGVCLFVGLYCVMVGFLGLLSILYVVVGLFCLPFGYFGLLLLWCGLFGLTVLIVICWLPQMIGGLVFLVVYYTRLLSFACLICLVYCFECCFCISCLMYLMWLRVCVVYVCFVCLLVGGLDLLLVRFELVVLLCW